MLRLRSPEWRPLLFGLGGALTILALALGSRAQATNRLFQTIPTPTPRIIPGPGGGVLPGGESASGDLLTLSAEIAPQAVLPGDEVQLKLRLTNTATDAVAGIGVLDAVDAALQPVAVSATQGAVRVQGQSVFVDVGTMEAGQTALIIIRAEVDSEAQVGQIILNQAVAQFDGGQATSEVVAAGLPPSDFPATGHDRRQP
jgi:uncharacterized repeat protein (TIGR01451 family)